MRQQLFCIILALVVVLEALQLIKLTISIERLNQRFMDLTSVLTETNQSSFHVLQPGSLNP